MAFFADSFGAQLTPALVSAEQIAQLFQRKGLWPSLEQIISIEGLENGDVSVWDASSSSWITRKLTLQEVMEFFLRRCADVTLAVPPAYPADGYVLKFDGTLKTWIAAPNVPGPLALDGLTDVTAPSPSSGDLLEWSGTAWVPAAPPSVPAVLDDLTDVDFSGGAPSLGQILLYDGTKWVAQAPAGQPPPALDDLTDVTAPSPSSGDVLQWNGSAWVPVAVAVALDDLTDVNAPSPSVDSVLIYKGAPFNAWQSGAPVLALDGLSDVTAPTPSSGDVLSWNGSAWVNVVPAGGGATDLPGLSDVTITAPGVDQILSYDGAGQWLNSKTYPFTSAEPFASGAPSGAKQALFYDAMGAQWTNRQPLVTDCSDVSAAPGALDGGKILIWNGTSWALSSLNTYT